MEAADFFRYLFFTVAGAFVGALGSIATYRARFTLIDAKFSQEAERYATQRAHDKEMLEITLASMRKDIQRARRASARMERRQQVSIELMADIARKLGVEHRALGVDALTHSLAQAENE